MILLFRTLGSALTHELVTAVSGPLPQPHALAWGQAEITGLLPSCGWIFEARRS